MDYEKKIENLKKEIARLRKKVENLEADKRAEEYCDKRMHELIEELYETQQERARLHDRLKWMQKTGRVSEWERTEWGVRCPACGFECIDEYYLGEGKFCPECGCYMETPLNEWIKC